MTDSCSGQCQNANPELTGDNANDIGRFNGKFTREFNVPKMDCPSEERLIRLTLESVTPSVGLLFDIPNRKVRVFHDDNLDEITLKLEALKFGAKLETTKKTCGQKVRKLKYKQKKLNLEK